MLLNVSCIGRNDVSQNERAIGQARVQKNLDAVEVVTNEVQEWDGRGRARLIPDTSPSRLKIFVPERRTKKGRIPCVAKSAEYDGTCDCCHLAKNSRVSSFIASVPPDILDYDTSTDMVVMEGRNVTLRCAATGSPAPNITWRREDGQQIQLGNGEEVASVDGSSFNITKVNRLHMGSYLCIASNGVPPSVSKRIMLTVHFPPMIWVQNQLVGAQEGQKLTLECYSEAFPKSINYWTRDQDKIVPQGGKYDPVLKDNAYKIHMRLTINSVSPTDYGSYKCVSRNSLGDTDGSIKVYPISGSNSSITKYKGKARHNSGNNNILEGNQDMLKERDLKLRGRKENGGDVADYDESSATSNDSSLLLVILVALCLYLHHHPQMRTLHPA
ncbi:PREDICTED: protein CEPU-1-like [Cyphomyrmex costatus]|uniref:protein CEPU-1-like n=1 Tax=Cyphomyrmex costatus TaxID=456900 RepID=UPI0008522025|nr:PREDICTED: protein CEPU-1-like [Cyphomyrmex costatus]